MSSLNEREPEKYIAVVIAGFTKPPLMFPIISTIKVSVRPMTKALPPLANTIKTKRNVPRNSEANFIQFILSLLYAEFFLVWRLRWR